MDILSGREIIFEFKAAGGFAQIVAMDCATGIEASVTTPRHAARGDQQTLALRKLAKALDEEGIVAIKGAATIGDTIEKGDTRFPAPPSSKRGFFA